MTPNTVFNSDKNTEERWEELLPELRAEIEENGLNIKQNEELYISLLAHAIKDNEEGLQTLAEEEPAQIARKGETKTLDKSDSAKIKTIQPNW